MCRLKTCCCGCVSLRTGTIVAAIFTAVCCILCLAAALYLLLAIDETETHIPTFETFIKTYSDFKNSSDNYFYDYIHNRLIDDKPPIVLWLRIYGTIYIISFILALLALIFLVLALIQDNHSYCLVWMVLTSMMMTFISYVCLNHSIFQAEFYWILIPFLCMLFMIYLWIVVYSFYMEILDQFRCDYCGRMPEKNKWWR